MAYVMSRPDLMRFWNWQKNVLDPSQLSVKSTDTVSWICPNCRYEWETTVRGRANAKTDKCPCCEVNRVICKGINDCCTKYPDLALDFVPELNPDVDIYSEGTGSHKKIIWKCHTCSFIWPSPIYSRIAHGDEQNSVGQCPRCANNRHVVSFGEKYPLLRELYSPHNIVSLDEATRYSKDKLLWICEKHGEFDSTLSSMIRSVKSGNNGCPYCHGTKLSKEKSFGFLHPELVPEWSPMNSKSPFDVSVTSKYLAKWECRKCGNLWDAPVGERHYGFSNCKVCEPYGKNGRRFCDVYPEAKQFYSEANSRSITEYPATCLDIVKWKCEKGHEFEDSFYNYYQRGHFICSVCSYAVIVSGVNDLMTTDPAVVEWYDQVRNEKKVNEVSRIDSNDKTWWKCPTAGHAFQRPVRQMVDSMSCPICKGLTVKPGVNDLLTKYPWVKEIWGYDDNEANRPENIFVGTKKKLPFVSEKGHHFLATIDEMVNIDNGGLSQKDVVSAHEYLMKFWDYEANDLDPAKTPVRSPDKAYWKCPKCGYTWETTVYGRAHSYSDKCPCCDINRYIKKGVNDCLTVYPELALDYHAELNDGIDIYAEGVASKVVVRWKCHICGYEWDSTIYRRLFYAGKKRVEKCAHCAEIEEKKIRDDRLRKLNAIYSPRNKYAFDEAPWSREGLLWLCEKHGEFECTLNSMVKNYTDETKGCPCCSNRKIKQENSFAYLHPDLAVDWSPDNKVSPYDVRANSRQFVLWKCHVCGNEWKASAYERHRGHELCKLCFPLGKKGKRFSDSYPEAIKYYSPKNNKAITEFCVTASTEALWNCELGHEYYESFYNYHQRGHYRCKICSYAMIVPGVNDLQTCYPNIADWFDQDKNGIASSEISPISIDGDTWWICKEKGHSFQKSVQNMVRHFDCPICSGHIVITGVNDLLSMYPQMRDIWDYDARPTGPEKCFVNTVMPLPFRCSFGHHYSATIKRMEKHHFHCLVCKDLVVDPLFNSVQAVDPELVKEWSPNNAMSPDQAIYSLKKRRKWICPVCKNEYEELPSKRHIGDDSCPFCNMRTVCAGQNDIASKYPSLIGDWSPNNNRDISQVMVSVKRLHKWRCQVCHGDYLATLDEKLNGTKSCAICRNKRVLSGYNDLLTVYPQIARSWALSNDKKVDQVLATRQNEWKWTCDTCHGEYLATISDRLEREDVCPYCNNRKLLTGLNDLATVKPHLVASWSPANEKSADQVLVTNAASWLWICEHCQGEYQATITDRQEKEDVCPYCAGRKMLFNFNTLNITHSSMMSEWIETANILIGLYPDRLWQKSNDKAWWKCPDCCYEYMLAINQKCEKAVRNMSACPKCTGRRMHKIHYV